MRAIQSGLVSVALGALLLAGCGGSSSSSSSPSPGSGANTGSGFQLVSMSVPNNAQWQINRPIEFEFSQPVDFTTVNASSINIATMAGKPALGEFYVKSVPAVGGGLVALPNVIVWQPRCPTVTNYSDAGLDVGGVTYRVLVQGADIAGGIAVRSKSGTVLKTSQVRHFVTPPNSTPQVVFFDAVPGSPTPIVRTIGTDLLFASYLEIGGTQKIYLERDLAGNTITIEEVPINFLSDPASSVAVVLEFNQPLGVQPGNVSPTNLGLEFFDTTNGVWQPVPTAVEFVANCTQAGARVRLSPQGSIPQAALFRVRQSAGLQDLVGQVAPNDLSDFARFETTLVTVPGLSPAGDLADEIFEPFDIGGTKPGSLEDTETVFAEPRALWGNGILAPNFSFLGNGGPSGNFDLEIVSPTAIFNTSAQTFTGGPGFTPTAQQTAVNGVLQVRRLRIAEGATLRIVGPNPARIFATGEVEINGQIIIDGADTVLQPSNILTPNLPQLGGAGVGGGGNGGIGSPLTTTSTAKGGDGFGPFNAPGLGGRGGESGFRDTGQTTGTERRAGGGGGARLAADANVQSPPDPVPIPPPFPDERAKPGNNGAAQAFGALNPQTPTSPPQGGAAGPSAFVDNSSANDFYGLRLLPPPGGGLLKGELLQPTAGRGGGAGGDSINSNVFPNPVWTQQALPPSNEQKGNGGGGGAGQLQILSTSNIVFGTGGRIFARGGQGGHGESTNFQNTIGGASGGGSGGHVILQSSANIRFPAPAVDGMINARGGRGGDSDPAVFTTPQTQATAPAKGGNGGGGIVQLHVLTADNLTNLAGQALTSTQLNTICHPNPFVLLPEFGRISKARSKYIPLGGANLNPQSSTGDVTFFFEGTDSDPLSPTAGEILRAAGVVADVTPILSGISPLSVDPGARRVVLSATGLVDDDNDPSTPFLNDIYLRNTALLREFKLTLSQGLLIRSFTVASASFDPNTVQLTLNLDNTGGSLADFSAGSAQATLIPRYFRVITGSTFDSLPTSTAIEIRFEAVRADANGLPDTASAPLVEFTPDIEALNSVPEEIGFIRFEVEFNLDVQGTGLNANSPRPSLTFLRVPFRF